MIKLFILCPTLGFAGKVPLFFAFGDWGQDTGTFKKVVKRLKAQPEAPTFVALLGDAFYPKGVESVDDPQFNLFKSFSDISEHFLVAIGNHDYGYESSVPAMIEYSNLNPKWILPSRYYMKTLQFENGYGGCAFVLDTHVFDSAQLTWLESSLKKCQDANWYRIIFAHHPLLTVGLYSKGKSVARLRNQIAPLIDKYGVHAYISGHEHQMQALEWNGVHYIVSGATSQMSRRTAYNATEWKNELKFFNDRDAAFAAFYIDPDLPTSISYSYIRASDGKTMYSSSIPLNGKEGDNSLEGVVEVNPLPAGMKNEQERVLPVVSAAGTPTGPISNMDDTNDISSRGLDYHMVSFAIALLVFVFQ